MKLSEIKGNFVDTNESLSQLTSKDRELWHEFFAFDENSCRQIVKFLDRGPACGLKEVQASEKARNSLKSFFKSKNIVLPKYPALYRGTLLERGHNWEVGKEAIFKLNRVSYWSQNIVHARYFVDEDDPAALLRTDANHMILFDLNVLPFPGGRDDREPELILRPSSMRVEVMEIHNDDEDE
ncbi:hypothetical protein [Acinetobacter sp.]|uniref:hypothetical protein n=1 Tax=Acinetobacter sp. TaxID=472 RepID=UPI0038910119